MSISSFFGSQLPVAVPNLATHNKITTKRLGFAVTIECSSRPQKKATAHHMKTRPRKTQAWDINRKPTVYAPLPPLPPDWSLLPQDELESSDGGSATAPEPQDSLPSDSLLQAPLVESG